MTPLKMKAFKSVARRTNNRTSDSPVSRASWHIKADLFVLLLSFPPCAAQKAQVGAQR